MQNNQPDKTQASKEKALEGKPKPLLTRKEVQNIVKDFAIAYVSGHVRIKHLTSQEIETFTKELNEPMDHASAMRRELDEKSRFKKQVAICLGAMQATPEEFEQTITELFDSILCFRNGNRIEGQFTESNLESRVRELEKGMEKANNLIEELVEYLMKGN